MDRRYCPRCGVHQATKPVRVKVNVPGFTGMMLVQACRQCNYRFVTMPLWKEYAMHAEQPMGITELEREMQNMPLSRGRLPKHAKASSTDALAQ